MSAASSRFAVSLILSWRALVVTLSLTAMLLGVSSMPSPSMDHDGPVASVAPSTGSMAADMTTVTPPETKDSLAVPATTSGTLPSVAATTVTAAAEITVGAVPAIAAVADVDGILAMACMMLGILCTFALIVLFLVSRPRGPTIVSETVRALVARALLVARRALPAPLRPSLVALCISRT